MNKKLMCKILSHVDKYGKSTTSDMYITHGRLSEKKYSEEELSPSVEYLFDGEYIKARRFKTGKPGYNRYTILSVTELGYDFLEKNSKNSLFTTMFSLLKFVVSLIHKTLL